jgi:hypothetical protein
MQAMVQMFVSIVNHFMAFIEVNILIKLTMLKFETGIKVKFFFSANQFYNVTMKLHKGK